MKDINHIPEIRAFIFDVDGTLYQQNKLRRLLYKKMAMYLFSNPFKGIEAILSVLSYRWSLEKMRYMELNDGPLNDIQFDIASRICLINKKKIYNHVYRWMKQEPLYLFKQVKYPHLDLFLKEAKYRGFKLAAFSDYPIENKLDALDLQNIFDLEISSKDSNINKLKPDPAGIEFIIKRFGLDKKEVIYVGDRHDIDAKTALNAGVKCIIIGKKGGMRSDRILYVRSYENLFYLLKNKLWNFSNKV